MGAFIETNLYGAKTQWATAMIDSTRTLLVGTELCNVSSRWSLTSVASMGIRFLEALDLCRIDGLWANLLARHGRRPSDIGNDKRGHGAAPK